MPATTPCAAAPATTCWPAATATTRCTAAPATTGFQFFKPVGNDTLPFGNDTLSGFDANPTGGQDKIDLTYLGITSATFGARVAISGGANAVVTVVNWGTITLTGVHQAGIT